MKLTTQDIAVLMPLIDAGVRSAGVQTFQNGGGAALQDILDRMQKHANTDGKPEE